MERNSLTLVLFVAGELKMHRSDLAAIHGSLRRLANSVSGLRKYPGEKKRRRIDVESTVVALITITGKKYRQLYR